MYEVSGSLTIGAPAISSAETGLRRQAWGVIDAVAQRLGGELGEQASVEPVVVQVALDLEREELGGDHHPVLGVPVGQAVVGGVGAERAASVLVEADRQRDLGGAGLDRLGARQDRTAGGAAAVVDADERDAGQAELADERRGVAAVAAAAGGEVDVAPR